MSNGWIPWKAPKTMAEASANQDLGLDGECTEEELQWYLEADADKDFNCPPDAFDTRP